MIRIGLEDHGETDNEALTLAATVTMAAALAEGAAGPASANYRPPSIRQVCTAAANGGTLEGSTCVLPPGVTTAPNSYSATIAVTKTGAAGATVTFALSAGSLPPGLTMPAQSGSGTVIAGNPAKAGTYGFTVKATDGNLTATLAYQITVTVQGPPDQLLCAAADGSFLESGTCVLPDATLGVPYQGRLTTSHTAGGTLSIVAGALPAGLSLPAAFGASGDVVGGTVTQPLGEYNTYTFTAAGTGDQGQPLYQAYQISVDPNQPLTVVLPAGGPAGRPARAGRHAYHRRHLHLHHARQRLRRPPGNPAIQPHHLSAAAGQHHPASGRNRRRGVQPRPPGPRRRTPVQLVRRQ